MKLDKDTVITVLNVIALTCAAIVAAITEMDREEEVPNVKGRSGKVRK